MWIRKTAAGLAVALSLGACQGMSTSETVGTVGGAAAGAALGSRFGGGVGKAMAVTAGGVLGALAGREIARNIQPSDRQEAVMAEERALSSNQPITWNNPQTGNRGTIQPQQTYRNTGGQVCRDYTHTVRIEGRQEVARGTACQQPDGTWQLVS